MKQKPKHSKKNKFNKICGKSFSVQGGPVYFVPDDTCQTEYVNSKGYILKGRQSNDGQRGYRVSKS